MILSLCQIEEIGAAVIKDFNEFFFHDSIKPRDELVRATPIDQFAHKYLGLSVGYARLSADGSICGLTCYSDTMYVIEDMGVRRAVALKRNQVLLDSSFSARNLAQKMCGKRRFTLAHECAHQILFQMESDEVKQSFRRVYSERRPYSFRELKDKEDWNEWQANALGATLLMPQAEIQRAMQRYVKSRKLTNYGGRYSYADNLALSLLCQSLGVSKTAAIIRLRQLGYIEERPYREFVDPREVWA